MAKLQWNISGTKEYETGVSNVVLFPTDTFGNYSKGVAWNGVSSITETPSGAEISPVYSNNKKYVNILSAEEFSFTIEAFDCPNEFYICCGQASSITGLSLGQQRRKKFGLAYRTKHGNDILGEDYGYKLHLIYGALSAPTERGYSTINDSPEALSNSWEIYTTPVKVNGFEPISILTIDSITVNPDSLKDLESVLYGEDLDPRLPLPNEVITLIALEGLGWVIGESVVSEGKVN